MLVALLSALGSGLVVVTASAPHYVPQGPKFDWNTLPVFYHSSNKSGPYNDASIKFLASHFPMVTIEKFQGPCGYKPNASPSCHQESLIIAELKRVKTLNPNVSAIFYYNSVLDFPQYDLHGMFLARPDLMLHDEDGKVVGMSGGGHSNMDVFDFSQAEARQLVIEECVNATRSGYVDGCFLDRAVDGTPNDATNGNDMVPCDGTPAHSCRYNLNLSASKLLAYEEGHVQMLADLQKAIGDGPVIANHAYGPPHDTMYAGSVNFAMIEGFGANRVSIEQLRMAARNNRGVQAHAGKVDEDSVAAFLVGAGHRAYFGMGSWNVAEPTAHWDPIFAAKLGAPLSDCTVTADGLYERKFENNISVSFDSRANKGTITGWIPFPSPSPQPGPSPPPPGPPLPPPQPTATCPGVYLCAGVHDGDVKVTAASAWTTCCADCAGTPGCTQWCFTPLATTTTAGDAGRPTGGCHLHTDKGTKAPGMTKYCGYHNRTAGW